MNSWEALILHQDIGKSELNDTNYKLNNYRKQYLLKM